MSFRFFYWANTKSFSYLLKVVWLLVLLAAVLGLAKSCAVCSFRSHIVEKTGYLPNKENWDNIPDVQPPYNDDDSLHLPHSVNLEPLFPPIGNQGDKGTCVAWAVGYNLMTALNAIDSHWNTSLLAQPDHQTSPKDLWFAIPHALKGSNCSGTSFEAAFNALLSSGAASMADAPYLDMNQCQGSPMGDSNNRIISFFQVVSEGQIPSVTQIKSYIADSVPLVIGARLGDRFISWHGDGVISHDTYTYSGMHAYHAMVLVGYDDARHAFRLRNSWGSDWGDKGSIWVDYHFFCNEMCDAVLMAQTHLPDSTQQNVPSH